MFSEKYGPWGLIAGGSEGIGACMADMLAARGLNLVLVARKPAPLQQLADEIRLKYGVEVRVKSCDLTSDTIVEELRTLTDDIEVGLLAYIAGSVGPGSFFDQPMDELMHTVRLDALSPLALSHHFGAKMRERKRGAIILGGSGAGLAGAYNFVAYSAAKAFEQMLAEGMWFELRPHGVEVLCIVIHGTSTPYANQSSEIHLETDDRDVMTPGQVAQEAIDNIANGPTWFAGAQNREFDTRLCTLDRRSATEALSARLALTTDRLD